MTGRASDRELQDRIAAALELLRAGYGSALTASELAGRFGVSLRTARRYVSAASWELCDTATPLELDRQAMLTLHRLDLIAGRALQLGDDDLAVKASRAQATALAQFRRAIEARGTRYRLPPSRAVAPPGDPPADCPF